MADIRRRTTEELEELMLTGFGAMDAEPLLAAAKRNDYSFLLEELHYTLEELFGINLPSGERIRVRALLRGEDN